MKKVFLLVLTAILIFSFSACANTLKGDIIEKARKEVPLADADDVEMKIIGSHRIAKNLF